MESRANYALVGLFTLAVIAAMFGFVYWFGSGGGGRKQDVRVIFTGTVTGLGRGSSVLFNGLRVGEVKEIGLQPDDPRRIFGVIEVDNTTPLRVDTRARIEAQGLAGVVALQLIGGEPDAVAKAVEKAIDAKRAPIRMRVTPSAHLLVTQRKLLGSRAWDAFVATQFRRPGT